MKFKMIIIYIYEVDFLFDASLLKLKVFSFHLMFLLASYVSVSFQI